MIWWEAARKLIDGLERLGYWDISLIHTQNVLGIIQFLKRQTAAGVRWQKSSGMKCHACHNLLLIPFSLWTIRFGLVINDIGVSIHPFKIIIDYLKVRKSRTHFIMSSILTKKWMKNHYPEHLFFRIMIFSSFCGRINWGHRNLLLRFSDLFKKLWQNKKDQIFVWAAPKLGPSYFVRALILP